MIYYNNQLMPSSHQLRLFMVENPTPFLRYEDHEAAIQIQLYDIIEEAFKAGEKPIDLIEEYLGVSYKMGHSIPEIAAFLFQTGEMMHAVGVLKTNWQAKDDSLPEEESLRFGGVNQHEAINTYMETTFRNYLEALVAISN